MLKQQKIWKQFLMHTTVQCLSQIVLKFGLHWSTHSSLNFAEKWLTCCWFKRRRHLVENCGRMIRDSEVVTIESIGNHHRSFEWYYRWPLWPPLLQSGGPECPAHDQLRDACCHLANMIEDNDKISFAYDMMSRAMSPLVKLLLTLVLFVIFYFMVVLVD